MRALSIAIMLMVMLSVVAVGQIRFAQNELTKEIHLTGNLRADLTVGFEMGALDSLKGTLSQYDEQKKSPLLAGLFSAAVPGAGEFYTQSYWRAGGFLAAEVALWVVYAAYTSKGNDQTDLFQNYADDHWSVVRYAEWIQQYAGQLNPDADCSGLVTGNGSQPPWERVDWARLNSCEDVIAKKPGNGFTHRLPRRPEQQYYELIGKYPQFAGGWDDGTTITPADIVASKVSLRFLDYAAMRGKANDFYNIASTSASVLVANHILSALDAAWSATQFNHQLKLEAHLKPTLRPYGFVEFVPTATARFTF
ncbi:MAG: hypothetical protein HY276_11025 [Ignavibacteriales bacterium]|nr:hypothetical protein [Ignavibacteriales bacterium]